MHIKSYQRHTITIDFGINVLQHVRNVSASAAIDGRYFALIYYKYVKIRLLH